MNHHRLTIIVFTLMNFVLAMLSSVFNGILDEIAVAFDISVAKAGLLTSMYAYGAAFGVPVTLIVFRKIERSRMLKIVLFVTILSTLALVLARGFGLMLVIRLIMGIASFSYSVLAISTVSSISRRDRQGRSVALLISGNALALAVGIPLTRALSSVLSWRIVFSGLIVIMAAVLLYFLFFLPDGKRDSDHAGGFGTLKNKEALLIYAFSFVMFIGYGALYTYIAPYLLHLFPSAGPVMALILALLGVFCFLGNLLGGYVSDRIGYPKAMLIGAAAQLAAAALIFAFRCSLPLSVGFSLLWIMSAWFTGLQLNTGIAQATENKSSFMIGVNSSCIQLGTAVGASVAAAAASLWGIQLVVIIAFVSCVFPLCLRIIRPNP